MTDIQMPKLSEENVEEGLLQARNSPRQRHPKILHKHGDEFNRVFNFMMQNSYMQPHLHPGDEKIEKIYLVQGKIGVLFFKNDGHVKMCTVLDGGGAIEVPAFTWHTYVMLSEYAVTYETMMGIYDPHTWKNYAEWAPREDSPESSPYLNRLKEEVLKRF